MNAIVLLFGLVACAYSQTQLNGNLGVSVAVAANTLTQINFLGGAELLIQTDTAAQVTLSSYISIQTTLPQGFSTLSFGAQLGFTFDVTPATATITVSQLTTPALTLNAAALLVGGVSAGCLQFDSSTQAYSQLTIDSYSAVTREITVTLPSRGIYVFVGVQQDVPIPTFYNQVRTLAADVRTQLSYASKLLIDVTAETTTNITVAFSSNTQEDQPDGYVSLNAYFDINLSTASDVVANLTYAYSEAELQAEGIVESALQWGYFDEVNGEWNFDGETEVDTSARVVSKVTNHFSTWGIYSSSASTLVPSIVLALLAFLMLI